MLPQFELQSHVDFLYESHPRRLAFAASDRTECAQWQRTLREKVRELLGLAGRTPPANPGARQLQTSERLGYVEEKWALDVGEGVRAPIYLLIPESEPPHKPVLVFHGHNPSVQYILGNYPNPEIARTMRAKDNNYAEALVQAGYFVCAVEQRGFGERITQGTYDSNPPRACRHLAFEYMMQGRTLLGERCWDGMCTISYLQTRDDIAPNTLGCTGNSGGATTALWLSAIDERITVSVPSCYFCSFKDSILGVRHCECNYVPGALEWMEMGDLAALIAPRPLRAIAGEQDPIFPIHGAREQFTIVKQAYALHNAAEKCSLAVHPGAHAYNHSMSHEWLARWL